MKTFTVSFFGHRRMEDPLKAERLLEEAVRRLLREKEYVEFLVGRDGEFDLLTASVVRRCKRLLRDDNSTLVWVLPYVTAEYRNNCEAYHRYYDQIEVCEDAAAGHCKSAHQRRNQQMVDRSNFAFFWVEREYGGAYQTMCYAQKKNIPHCNLAKEIS